MCTKENSINIYSMIWKATIKTSAMTCSKKENILVYLCNNFSVMPTHPHQTGVTHGCHTHPVKTVAFSTKILITSRMQKKIAITS